MELKVKEAVSVFVAIALISIAAGGDYYYSEMNQARCLRQLKRNNAMSHKESTSMQNGLHPFSKKGFCSNDERHVLIQKVVE